MKLFGVFLVEQGIITKSDLVGALIEQVKSTPSVSEIVHSFGVVSDEDFLEIFEVQHQNKCDFISACQEAGAWRPELEERVLTAIRAVRKPLGRILYDAGKLTSSQLAHALDEFVVDAEDDAPAIEEKNSTKTIDVVLEDISDQPLSESLESAIATAEGIEFEFVATTFDKSLLEQFLAVFSVDLYNEMIGKVASLECGSLQAVQLSEEILEAVLPVVASAKFIRASLLARILITLEDVLELMTENKADVAKAKLAAKDCLDLAWAVRDGLEVSGTEADSWSNELIKNRFAMAITAADSLKNSGHKQAA